MTISARHMEQIRLFQSMHPDYQAYRLHKSDCKRSGYKWIPREEFLVAYKALKAGVTCQICRLKPATVLDHNHETGKFRGFLCRYCNTGMGFWDKFKKEAESYARGL